MSNKDENVGARTETDTSLLAERQNTDRELTRRAVIADADADEVLRLARERADRLLAAARLAADSHLPLSEQTEAAVAALLRQREVEDRTLASEREQSDQLVERERRERLDKLTALLVVERHTTDLHLALERRAADRAVSSRDDTLAQVSHDLRGLMAAQKIYFSLLVKEVAESAGGSRLAPQLAALAKIDSQMHRLVSDLVDVVAIEAGKLAVTLGTQSALELLSTATALFEPLARERGQSLSVMAGPADVRVVADGARAVQVLANLLSNAIKFSPEQGKIRVGFEGTPQLVTFFVADTGPGVPPEQAEDIFERFSSARAAHRASGSACSSLGASSTPMGGACGSNATLLSAPCFGSRCGVPRRDRRGASSGRARILE